MMNVNNRTTAFDFLTSSVRLRVLTEDTVIGHVVLVLHGHRCSFSVLTVDAAIPSGATRGLLHHF